MNAERRKATRALKKLQKRAANLSPSSLDSTSLAKLIHEAEVDLNYTMYCPLTEKYQSLYRKAGKRKSEEGEQAEADVGQVEQGLDFNRPPLWTVVERSMAEGTLQSLRDGKLTVTTSTKCKAPTQRKKHTFAKNSNKGGGVGSRDKAATENARKLTTQDDDEMSDGGFFEE